MACCRDSFTFTFILDAYRSLTTKSKFHTHKTRVKLRLHRKRRTYGIVSYTLVNFGIFFGTVKLRRHNKICRIQNYHLSQEAFEFLQGTQATTREKITEWQNIRHWANYWRCVIAQTVSRRLPAAETLVQFQSYRCRICGEQSCSGSHFPRGTSVFPPNYCSTKIIEEQYNRPICGHSTEGLSLTPLLK
jgi:hypothetical protein